MCTIIHALHVHVGPEESDLTIGLTIGFHPFKDALSIVEDGRAWFEG